MSGRFKLRSYNGEVRLVEILQNSYVEDKYLDYFVYEIARELNVSIDYLYGWIDFPGKFIQSSKDPITKLSTVKDIIDRYSKQEGIVADVNTLAYKCNIDRSVAQYIFDKRKDPLWASCITTSYYIIKRLSDTFNLNFGMIMKFLVDADEDPKVDEVINWYINNEELN